MMGRPQSDVPDEYRSWRRLPGLLLGAFRVVREAAPREFAISTILQLVQGAASGIQVLVVRNILAAVLAGSSHHDYLPAIQQLVVLVALQTVTGLVGTYTNMQQQLVTELVQRHASRPVTEVATTIGLKDFDTPEFHDRMQRAQQTATVRPLQITQSILTIGHSLLGLAGVVIALLILSPLLLAVSLLGFLPLWLATSRISRAVYEFMLEMTPNDRKRGYVLGLLTSSGMAKEVRAFGLGRYFRTVYERLSDERIARLRQHLRHRAGLSFLGSAGNAVAGGTTFGVLAWLITTGRIGLATAGAAAMATFQLGSQLQGIVFAGGQLYESSLFIEDLEAFLAVLPALKAAQPKDPAPRGFRQIEVRNVHFRYPITTSPPAEPNGKARGRRGQLPMKVMAFVPMMFFGGRPPGGVEEEARRPHALKGVSMVLNQGEVVALVGENAPLIILDEPTASLDARAEAELFERIRSLFQGRSVLLISHRFSSVRAADRIYVMNEGEIIEDGSHEELIQAGGLYAELFNLQAAAYLDSEGPT